MDELRKKHRIQFTFNGVIINGFVVDYTTDRVMVSIFENSIPTAKLIKELDELEIDVYTHYGIKKMVSSVISELNSSGCIVIENSPAFSVNQKRQFARVTCSFKFKIIKNSKTIDCECTNISAGGIAFKSFDQNFSIGDEVKFCFFECDFGRDIICFAEIVKKDDDIYAAQFKKLSLYDEDRIVKYIFKLMVHE